MFVWRHGKTSWCLAARLGRGNELVQQHSGETIATIFERLGEPGFRALESAALGEVARAGGQVVALGGGTCLDPANRQVIRQSGRTVWLTAVPEILWQRLAADPVSATQRPSLGKDGPAGMAELLAARRDTYAACAALVLATDRATPEQLASLICRWWADDR